MPVAIKMFKKKDATPKYLNAARFERKVMKSLNHDNIMSLLDQHEDDEVMYLVMDLMTDDLRNIINYNNSPLDVMFTRKMF